MNPGNSVQDVNTEPPPRPSGQDDASRYAATADNGSTPARSPKTPVPPQVPRSQRAVQDIQDIIDKLAAVTQQLRHPHRN
jgi:hypothetical protein